MNSAPQLNFPTELPLIDHAIEGGSVHQRPKDGYVNATDLCKAAGKRFNDYARLGSTKEFLQELSAVAGIPVTEQNQELNALIYTIQGGKPELQGTWVHPDVAVNLAQWLSPKFAVRVSQIINDWLKGNVSGYMPPHVKRYIQNKRKIPPTHFSMLNEVYLELFAPLDDAGIQIPTTMTPDISTGRMFSDFLRRKGGYDPDAMPTYEHEYPDGRIVKARLYPIELLGEFRLWFNNEWLPHRAVDYFKSRLPQGLPYIQPLIDASNGRLLLGANGKNTADNRRLTGKK